MKRQKMLRTGILATALAVALAWAGAVTACASEITLNYTGSIVTEAISSSGLYEITVYGAEGGSSDGGFYDGGLGAEASGEFTLSADSSLQILVGQAGVDAAIGGSGGSFVVLNNSTLLVAAGGGGGAGVVNPGITGQSSSSTA